eukprot:1916945-Pyramimonas_sp.AAC.1
MATKRRRHDTYLTRQTIRTDRRPTVDSNLDVCEILNCHTVRLSDCQTVRLSDVTVHVASSQVRQCGGSEVATGNLRDNDREPQPVLPVSVVRISETPRSLHNQNSQFNEKNRSYSASDRQTFLIF